MPRFPVLEHRFPVLEHHFPVLENPFLFCPVLFRVTFQILAVLVCLVPNFSCPSLARPIPWQDF